MSSSLAHVLQHPAIRRGDGFAQTEQPTQPSGFAVLDAVLPHGGWPLGAVSELVVPQAGSGELTLLLPLLSELTRSRRSVYLIAPPAVPYAPAWRAAGVVLERVLWLVPKHERDALWACEQILRDTGNTVLTWLDRVPHDKSCRRLQLAAEQGRSLGLLLRPDSDPCASTPFGLRLRVAPRQDGTEITVLKRRGPPVPSPILIRRTDHVVVSLFSAAPAAGRIRPGFATA